ncbi:hypothetical protein ACOSQ3_012649 [Xanthoceras sorbifolium]
MWAVVMMFCSVKRSDFEGDILLLMHGGATSGVSAKMAREFCSLHSRRQLVCCSHGGDGVSLFSLIKGESEPPPSKVEKQNKKRKGFIFSCILKTKGPIFSYMCKKISIFSYT